MIRQFFNALLAAVLLLHTGDALQNLIGNKKNVSLPASAAKANEQRYGSKSSSPKEVPILCFHQIRPYTEKDGEPTRSMTVTPGVFNQLLKALHDSGYHTILPDDLYHALNEGAPLPPKPVMLSFDDGTIGQFSEGVKTMRQYGFRGVFFIMTVSIDKPGFIKKNQIQTLEKEGHVVGCHTWDHQNVKRYNAGDWATQLDKPRQLLQDITGSSVDYFAYPYGACSEQAIEELKKRKFKLAFVLDTPVYSPFPHYTVRRLMANGQWTPGSMLRTLQHTFPERY